MSTRDEPRRRLCDVTAVTLHGSHGEDMTCLQLLINRCSNDLPVIFSCHDPIPISSLSPQPLITHFFVARS